MRKFFALSLALLLLSGCVAAPESDPEAPPEPVEEIQVLEKEPASSDLPDQELHWCEGVPLVSFEPSWQAEGSSRQYLQELCDPKYQGRVPGNPGNQAAADYVQSQFERLGLQPLPSLGKYRQTIHSYGFHLEPQGTAALLLPDGSSQPLTLGSDWTYSASWKEVDVTLPLSPDLELCRAGKAILDGSLTDQGLPISVLELRVGDVTEGMPYVNVIKDKPTRIKVTPEVYEQLKQPGAQLRLQLPDAVEMERMDNVIGYLPGKDRNKAVLLYTTFWGHGQSGNDSPGAYSTAGAMATTLQTADWLSKAPELPCDVIFAARCTEYGREELEAIESHLREKCGTYRQIISINIRSVGWKDQPLTVYAMDNESILRSELAGGLGLQYRAIDKKPLVGGSFHSASICQDALERGKDEEKRLGSPQDNIAVLDLEMLDQLAKDLCAWIMERSAQSMAIGDNMIFW